MTRNDIWLGAHLALATDSGIDIEGNECDASSVLRTLHALCPEFIGCIPGNDQLIEYGMKEFGWTHKDALYYMGEG